MIYQLSGAEKCKYRQALFVKYVFVAFLHAHYIASEVICVQNYKFVIAYAKEQ